MFSFNGGGSDQAGSLASLSSCAAWIWHLIEELLPVDSKEPLAFLDIIDSVFQIAESLPQIGRKELFDENLFPNIFSTGSLSSTESSCALSPRWPSRRPVEPLFLLF